MSELAPPKDDALYIPVVGQQSKDKHFFLNNYIGIFTTSMRRKWKLHYVDLFAGAGMEKLKDSGQINWGSPLIAANTRFPFQRLHLCEKNRRKFDALESRILEILPDSQVLCGDANEKVHAIVGEIENEGSLSLAFLDPYGLDLAFETLRALATIRADLIIFFPDRLDVLRNWKQYYYDDRESKLDRHLGSDSNWRSVLDNAPPNKRVEHLRSLYVQRLKEKLGYLHVEYERIPTHGRPLYYLVFCSRSELGARFWRDICRNKRDGQKTFRFE